MHEKVQSGEIREKILRRLDELEDLPSIPEVVNRVIRALSDSNTSAEDVARIMHDDPAMTAKVLKIVNSPFYGARDREITSVAFAVSRMGFHEIRKIAFSMGVLELFKGSKKVLDHKLFWQHCIATAIGASVINRYVDQKHKAGEETLSTYFVGGLLHDVGMLVFEAYFHEAYSTVIQICTSKKISILQAEDEGFGITHEEVGEFLCRKWNLPEKICNLVRYHHSYYNAPEQERMAVCHVTIADYLANQMLGGLGEELAEAGAMDAFPAEAWKYLGLPRENLKEVLEDIEQEAQRSEVFLSLVS